MKRGATDLGGEKRVKPNILYIHSHDTGRYIQPYGHAVPTPNLQRLAEEGVLFRQCFCANPTCSASRSALVTGSYPHQNGMLGLAHRGWRLNDYKQHMLHTLRDSGYYSALSGIQHIAHREDKPWGKESAEPIGYDEYLANNNSAEVGAVAFLKGTHDKPFFLSVGFSETHRAFPSHLPADDPRYALPPAPLPDTPETRKDMAEYKTSVRILDQKMGSVFAALEENGLVENTLVICTTDHGIAFPRMKCNLHDSGTGVMLIMRGPGGFTGGRVCDSMVSHVDIFPTICDLLAIEHPEWLEGKSIMPWVERGENIRDEVFAEVNFHASVEPMRSIRTDRFKYIRRYDGRRGPVLPNTDDSLSKKLWTDNNWDKITPDSEMLFNLVFDPNETNNLTTCAEMKQVLEEMRERLKRMMEKTDDPLLKGILPIPDGARLTPADVYSPGSDGVEIVPAGEWEAAQLL